MPYFAHVLFNSTQEVAEIINAPTTGGLTTASLNPVYSYTQAATSAPLIAGPTQAPSTVATTHPAPTIRSTVATTSSGVTAAMPECMLTAALATLVLLVQHFM